MVVAIAGPGRGRVLKKSSLRATSSRSSLVDQAEPGSLSCCVDDRRNNLSGTAPAVNDEGHTGEKLRVPHVVFMDRGLPPSGKKQSHEPIALKAGR